MKDLSPGRVRIAYVLLAHEAPARVVAHAQALLDSDPTGHVILHYDAAQPAAAFAEVEAGLAPLKRARLLRNRVRSGWGQFGLVEAALRAMRLARSESLDVDFFHLISVSCAPIQSIAAFKAHLAARPDTDFLECAGPDWIIGGLRDERHTLYHLFNERKYRTAFYLFANLQRLLRIRRRMPLGMTPRFGSQWWTLSAATVERLLALLDKHPGVVSFFRKTWVPDELFFQTVVSYLKDGKGISGHSLTYYKFTNQGKPIVFYDDHYNFLKKQPFFFARKIGPNAQGLKAALWRRAAQDNSAAPLRIGVKGRSYELQMRVQSTPVTPGQIFFGDQMADDQARVLRAAPRRHLVIWGLPSALSAFSEALPSGWRAVRLDAPAAESAIQETGPTDAVAQVDAVLWSVAPALALATIATRGERCVATITTDAPASLIERLRDDPNVVLVNAFPWPARSAYWLWLRAVLDDYGYPPDQMPETTAMLAASAALNAGDAGLADLIAELGVQEDGGPDDRGWRATRPLEGEMASLEPYLDDVFTCAALQDGFMAEELNNLPPELRAAVMALMTGRSKAPARPRREVVA